MHSCRNSSPSAKRLIYRTVSQPPAMMMLWPRTLLLLFILLNVLPDSWMQAGEVRAAARTDATARAQQPSPELKAGAPIQRNLAGGESHAYRILLATGQYLRVRIEPHDLDVVATLFTPAGEPLIERDRNEEG